MTFSRPVLLLDHIGREIFTTSAPTTAKPPSPSEDSVSDEVEPVETVSSFNGCAGASAGSSVLTLSLRTTTQTTFEEQLLGLGVSRALYVNGSGTDTLEFTYRVRERDHMSLLDVANITSLEVDESRGQVVAMSTYPTSHTVSLTLPRPGWQGSMSYDQNVTLIGGERTPTFVRKITANVMEGCFDPGDRIMVSLLSL